MNLTPRIKESGVLEIRDRLGQISGGKILDVGTSSGDFMRVLMKSLKDYESFVGIDISAKEFENTKQSPWSEQVKFELMNAEEMQFDDNSFDTVCSSFSLHHLKNINLVLSEMKRVLKKGGHLFIQEMFSDKDQSDAQLTEILIHHLDARVNRTNGIPHFDTYSRQQLNDFVEKLELSSTEVYESKASLQCVFCDAMEQCEDPRSDRNIKSGLRDIDDILKNATGLSIFSDIQEKAEDLKERVKTTGFRDASLLFFICTK